MATQDVWLLFRDVIHKVHLKAPGPVKRIDLLPWQCHCQTSALCKSEQNITHRTSTGLMCFKKQDVINRVAHIPEKKRNQASKLCHKITDYL